MVIRFAAGPSVSNFVLAPRWPATLFNRRHPLGRTPTTFAPSIPKAFQHRDCLPDLLAFLSQLGQHLHDVHLGRAYRNPTASGMPGAPWMLGMK
jgi:hypothetical protein